MTHIKELIRIPDQIGRGDFVLRLSEGVTDPERTVAQYQVTPQLVKCFDEALNLVKGAVEGSSSKAAYLHGSFGSGKSHFMAILHLLLRGDSHARSIPELADVIAKHNAWIQGKKFLLVPYHLIAAKNLESAILGGYAEYVRRQFPDAPAAAVFRAEGLFANAEQLRKTMGDETFFAKLNEAGKGGSGAGGGWGNISATWTASSYAEARAAAPSSERCRNLVRDLVETLLPAMRQMDEFVDLDDGLAIMSAHAKAMGFSALILFLDELILWLASYAAEPVFVSQESQKVVKLVEADRADRPAPIVSFVARQRDLRELVGQHIAGSERLAFRDVLDHHEGRFSVIRLEDRNLPAIAAKRILAPVSDAAKKAIDAEFEQTTKVREEVMNTLLARHANREDFRKLYPFSPALVETLVAVSSVLQRERTALKVMASLLVDQRDTLQLGQIVPVGDLFDQVSQGDEAFNADMRAHFENAHRLYERHLKPLIEREHDLTFEEAQQLPWGDTRRKALRNDDRLIKTLLLAALVPEVEALKNLTPARIAALNHGTIKSPIPGQEGATVLNKVQRWAAAAGQIKIREGAGGVPTISLQLSGVDAEHILAQAESVDNPGNRIRKLKDLLFEQMGVSGQDELFFRHPFRWRGTDRECEVFFGNLREFPDETIRSDGDTWKILIDYPFDSSGHHVRDDIARMEQFRSEHGATRTICWLPSFFGRAALDALGVYVRLEQILKENQFPNYVRHLTAVDRDSARGQLENQRDQLKNQLVAQIEMAYGLRSGGEAYLDPSNVLEPSEQFYSLDPSLPLKPPVAANMRQALGHLLAQALAAQYPAHPGFEDDTAMTRGTLTKVLEVAKAAAQSQEPSVLVEQSLRKGMLRIAVPLKLGDMGETRFQIGSHWKLHFTVQQAQSTTPLSVGKLRKWLDIPQPMGLPAMVQDLVILAYAEQTNRIFKLHGGPVQGDIGKLQDDMVLEQVALPGQDTWSAAAERAKAIFGIPVSPLLNAANLAMLAEQLTQKHLECAGAAAALLERLREVKAQVLPQMGDCARLGTAQEAHSLLKRLGSASGNDVVTELAEAPLSANPNALGASIANASAVHQALLSADWMIFQGIRALGDDRRAEADRICGELESAFQADEYVVALGPTIASLKTRAVQLLTKVSATPAGPRPEPEPPRPVPMPRTVESLKALYDQSQAEGDVLPSWAAGAADVLTVHVFGPDANAWGSMVVVSPTMKALIELDPNAEVDLPGGTLRLPRFGQTLVLRVNPKHLE